MPRASRTSGWWSPCSTRPSRPSRSTPSPADAVSLAPRAVAHRRAAAGRRTRRRALRPSQGGPRRAAQGRRGRELGHSRRSRGARDSCRARPPLLEPRPRRAQRAPAGRARARRGRRLTDRRATLPPKEAVEPVGRRRHDVLRSPPTDAAPGLPDGPIYAPARIAPDKGQADVLRVAEILQEAERAGAGAAGRPRRRPRIRRRAARDGPPRGAPGWRRVPRPADDGGRPGRVRGGQAPAPPHGAPGGHAAHPARRPGDGRAPLVYEAGGVREGVRDGETGFVLPPGDVEGMARVAEALLRDPARRLAVAQAGREFVEAHFRRATSPRAHRVLPRGGRAGGWAAALAQPAADEA